MQRVDRFPRVLTLAWLLLLLLPVSAFANEQCATQADGNPQYYGGESGHAIWMPDIGKDLVFTPDAGSFIELPNGTATLSGTVKRKSNPNQGFVVEIEFSGRTSSPPPGSPKKELNANAYVQNGGPINPATWHYYTSSFGIFVGTGSWAGARVEAVGHMQAFQVGVGANGKNLHNGASGWFLWTVTSQPNSGPGLVVNGQGDYNIDLSLCPGDRCVNKADRDPNYYGGEAGHAIWMPDIGKDLVFTPDPASFVENGNGTATLSGTVRRVSNPNQGFDVQVAFSGRTATPPPMSPKKELNSNAYIENGGPINAGTWHYYTTFSGTFTGIGSWAGATVQVVPTGGAFQVGVGANGKNLHLGASGWFLWTVTSQPNSGPALVANGQGDFNLDFVFCPSEDCVSNADRDPNYYGGEAGHAIWMPDIAKDLVFTPTLGTFVENSDGTATLSGTARRVSNPNQGFLVEVEFSGRTDTPPPGNPKKELNANAYVENGGPIDASTWHYYTNFFGVFMGTGSWAGATVEVVRTGPAYQVGVGANGKNLNFGGSGWFLWDVTSQPNSGPSLVVHGQGDFNVDHVDCPNPNECVAGAIVYGVHDAGFSDSQFFKLNVLTGAMQAIGPVYPQYNLESLDIHPVTGRLYTFGAGDGAVQEGNLFEVNKADGSLTLIGNTGATGTKGIASASFHPDGTLWAFRKGVGLVTVDVNTAQMTLQWGSSGTSVGVRWDALAWAPDGSMAYGAQTTKLYRWNPVTRKAEKVCGDTFLPDKTEALDFDLNGTLVGGWHHPSTQELSIFAIDPVNCTLSASGYISPIANMSDVEGIAFEITCEDENDIPGSIGDLVWKDLDGDGEKDANEPELAGVVVRLFDANDQEIAQTITNGVGFYLFSGLPSGTYSVRVDASTLPPGLAPTYDFDGTDTAHEAEVVLGAGENQLDVDFGYADAGIFCPKTRGYWKNHTEAWPVSSLSIGGVVYNAQGLLDLLNYGGSDAATRLASHLVATKLNLLSGSNPSIQPAVAAADAYLASHPPGSNPSGSSKNQANAIKDELDEYNNTPCDDEEPPGGGCVSSMMYGVHDAGFSDSQFFKIDLSTGVATLLGPVYPQHNLESLDIHPVTGRLYTFGAGDGALQEGNLFEVDKNNGSLTLIGNTGAVANKGIASASFHPDGTLWAFRKGVGLVTINLATAQMTLQWGSSGTSVGVRWDALAWAPDGSMAYGAQLTKLYRWNPVTRRAEKVCGDNFLPDKTEALDFDLNGNLVGGWHHPTTQELSIFAIDPVNCTLSASGYNTPITNNSDIEGIAFEVCD